MFEGLCLVRARGGQTSRGRTHSLSVLRHPLSPTNEQCNPKNSILERLEKCEMGSTTTYHTEKNPASIQRVCKKCELSKPPQDSKLRACDGIKVPSAQVKESSDGTVPEPTMHCIIHVWPPSTYGHDRLAAFSIPVGIGHQPSAETGRSVEHQGPAAKKT